MCGSLRQAAPVSKSWWAPAARVTVILGVYLDWQVQVQAEEQCSASPGYCIYLCRVGLLWAAVRSAGLSGHQHQGTQAQELCASHASSYHWSL